MARTYTITVVNNDIDVADARVSLDAYLTSSLTIIGATGWTSADAFRGYECTGPALALGATAPPIAVELTLRVGGTVYLSAYAGSDGIFGGGNIDVIVSAAADLELTAPTRTSTGGTCRDAVPEDCVPRGVQPVSHQRRSHYPHGGGDKTSSTLGIAEKHFPTIRSSSDTPRR